MSDLEAIVPLPSYGPEVPEDVAAECLKAWMADQPWTPIRVLRSPSECPPTAACEGSYGRFGTECPGKVAAVQYCSRYAVPQFYCEEHALLQNDWDIANYRSPPADRKHPGPEWQAEVDAVMKRLFKKKREEREETEEDL